MVDVEGKLMRGALAAAIAVIAMVGVVALGAIVAVRFDARPPVQLNLKRGTAPLDGTPVERTLALTVDNSANVEVRYSASMRHLLARCVNTSTGVNLFVVESTASNTTNGLGPFCDTCAGGATLPPLGTAYLRTSAGTATVRCGFVEDWPTAAINFTAPGAGGMSSAAADAAYLRLDGTNDSNVTADIDLPLGFSVGGNSTLGNAAGDTVTSNAAAWTFASDTAVTLSGGVNGLSFDGTTFSVDATNNRVGFGTAAPLALIHSEGAYPQLRLQGTGTATGGLLYNSSGTFVGGFAHDATVNRTGFYGSGYASSGNSFMVLDGATDEVRFTMDVANKFPTRFVGAAAAGNRGTWTFNADKDGTADLIVHGDTIDNLLLIDVSGDDFYVNADDATIDAVDDVTLDAGDDIFFFVAGAPVGFVNVDGMGFPGVLGGGLLANDPPVADNVSGYNLMGNSGGADPPGADCGDANEMGRYAWAPATEELFVCSGTDGWRVIASAAALADARAALRELAGELAAVRTRADVALAISLASSTLLGLTLLRRRRAA